MCSEAFFRYRIPYIYFSLAWSWLLAFFICWNQWFALSPQNNAHDYCLDCFFSLFALLSYLALQFYPIIVLGLMANGDIPGVWWQVKYLAPFPSGGTKWHPHPSHSRLRRCEVLGTCASCMSHHVHVHLLHVLIIALASQCCSPLQRRPLWKYASFACPGLKVVLRPFPDLMPLEIFTLHSLEFIRHTHTQSHYFCFT